MATDIGAKDLLHAKASREKLSSCFYHDVVSLTRQNGQDDDGNERLADLMLDTADEMDRQQLKPLTMSSEASVATLAYFCMLTRLPRAAHHNARRPHVLAVFCNMC